MQDPGRDDLGVVVAVSGVTWPARIRVKSVVVSLQTSKPRSSLTSLKPLSVIGWPSPSCDQQAVLHELALLAVLVGVDEEVEPALLDLELAAERVALDVAGDRARVLLVRDEALDVRPCSTVTWNMQAVFAFLPWRKPLS